MKRIIYFSIIIIVFILTQIKLSDYGYGIFKYNIQLPNNLGLERNFKSNGFLLLNKEDYGVLVCSDFNLLQNKNYPIVKYFTAIWYNDNKLYCEFIDNFNNLKTVEIYKNQNFKVLSSFIESHEIKKSKMKFIDLTKNYLFIEKLSYLSLFLIFLFFLWNLFKLIK